LPEFTLTINDPKTGKSYNKKIDVDIFDGRRINDVVQGESLGLPGYELKITGGSDKSGFPMRKDMSGASRRKILTTRSIGVNIKKSGLRRRKSVVGNQISFSTSQINLSVVKKGSQDLEETFGLKKEENKE